ncbi:MAG: cytidine deaminase [Armatimonadetes bacterium]|nr:cytidine deaminase [Armatimonadota bacterium]
MKFNGNFDELKIALAFTEKDGTWTDKDPEIKQFHYTNGVIINWATTGSIAVTHGSDDDRKEVRAIIECALRLHQKSNVSLGRTVKVTDDDLYTEPNKVNLTTDLLKNQARDSEIVIALVGAVGTELERIVDELRKRLETFNYRAEEIHVSKQVIPAITEVKLGVGPPREYDRINSLMDAGNHARLQSKDNAILALGAIAQISAKREYETAGLKTKSRQAYIISSLKHPAEVDAFREIYSHGFFLIGVYSSEEVRTTYLQKSKRIMNGDISKLIERDSDEHLPHGQRTSDTFHLSDFFIHLDQNNEKTKNSVWRILDLIFGHPNHTPTFDEYAMFLAFCASLRSADLARQVGAVIAHNNEILATGANDCPCFGGGLYWPQYDENSYEIIDSPEKGRDYKRGYDSNSFEKERIIYDILNHMDNAPEKKEELCAALRKSKLDDITEYGRVVHAEMEALLACARNGISSRSATLYCQHFRVTTAQSI